MRRNDFDRFADMGRHDGRVQTRRKACPNCDDPLDGEGMLFDGVAYCRPCHKRAKERAALVMPPLFI